MIVHSPTAGFSKAMDLLGYALSLMPKSSSTCKVGFTTLPKGSFADTQTSAISGPWYKMMIVRISVSSTGNEWDQWLAATVRYAVGSPTA